MHNNITNKIVTTEIADIIHAFIDKKEMLMLRKKLLNFKPPII